MKKHIILWMLMTILVNVLHSQTIGTAEYFFDTDPGIGNGFPFTMSITADSANSSQTVSVSALSVGFHRLYIRVKQSDGNWSLTDEELFYIYPTTATTITPLNQAQIKSGEYFFDTDPGVGNGTQINGFTVGDSIDYTSSISVGSLSVGFHRFYVRTKNATGNWSLPDEELIYIYSTTTPGSNPQSSQIQKLEYFLDNVDPGPGNGIAITNFSVSDSIQILDSLNVTVLSAGVHKINVRTKDISGNWSLSSVKEFSVLPCVLPVPNFSFTDVCLGDSIQLINTSTSLNSPTFSWDIMNDGSIENTSSSGFKYSINQAGSFQVKLKVTNQSLCSDSIIKTIIVHDLPNALASAIGNPVFCDGLSVVLTGNTGPSFFYQWQKDSVNITGATNLFYTANAAGYYRFKLTDSYGCSNVSNNVQVIVNPVPTASINSINGTNFCQGDSLSFSAPTGTGYSYQWKLNGVAIPQAILNTVWIKQSGVLTVEITNVNGCVSTSAATTVIMNYPPFAALLPLGSTTFCEGDSVGLGTTNGSAYTYQWYKNSNLINGANQSIYYAKESGDFYAKVTNANGCSSNSSLQSVVVNPMPIANFITLPEICQTDTALINFTGTSYGNALFNWNFDGGTILSGSGSGPYQIKYNSGGNKIIQLQLVENACMSSTKKDSIQVKSFAVTLSSISNPEICQGDSMILYVNSSNSFLYSWYKNNTLITGVNSASYTSADAGNYTVFVKDTVGGCSATSNVLNLVVNSGDFNIDFTATPTTLTSPPFNVQFNNNTPNYTNYFFEWSFDDGTSSTYFNPLHNYPYNGAYSVRLIAENQTTGCKDTLVKSNYIQCSGGQNNPCTITAGIISTGASLICAGDSSKLEANSGAGLSYQWTHNNVVIAGANQSVYYAKAVGVYRVIVSNSICSVVSNSFILSHYPGINPVIVASGSITPCTNDSMQLLLLNNYNSYHWSTSDTTASIWVNQTGYYTVTVTNNYNCNLVSNPYSVSTSFLMPPTICLVGVDTNNHNRIIWERPNTQLIDSFYVYREGFVANDYEKIGSVAYSAPGIFSDTNSNPQVRAYRYKMAALDTCGQMTLLGDYHKSIHLTINAGLNGTWNLIWDGYIGFPFGSYRIYRGTTANNLSLLTQIQSSLNSYSDINPPGGNVFYQIEVMKNSGCYPDSNFAKVNTNYNSSRSNTANNTQATPPQMNAEFSSDKTWGFLPAKIKFTDESSGYPSSWLWDFGDGQTSAQQNPEHTYTTQGIYDVTLTITNIFGNHTTTKTAFIYIITNGLGDQQSDFNLAIYPNPNNGLFTLLMNSDHKFNAQLEIVNSIGQIVYSDNVEFKTGDVRKELSLDNLDKGFYFVIIKSEKEKIVRKLLIQ